MIEIDALIKYLDRVAKEHTGEALSGFIERHEAPCYYCRKVCPADSMIKAPTGTLFCDHLCYRAYAE